MEDKERRKFACERNFFLFSVYYFTGYHFYETPQFHLEMYEDLTFSTWRYVLWVMFRESAKTSIAKMKLVHNIVYEKKKFNVWVSFDQGKAESNLFDVALTLQTNEKIIEDFGQLYYEEKMETTKSTKKSIEEFITANGVKVKAYSTGMSTRGEVFGEYRPDAYFIDDIETSKTIVSDARTQQVIGFLNELFAGVATDAEVLVMGNKLINDGSIADLEERAMNNPNWRYRNVPVITQDGEITWPDKFVKTNAEAAMINASIEDKKYWKVSLEQKKKDLGVVVYDREMLNKPLSDETREVKAAWLANRFRLDELKFKARNRFITIDSAGGNEMKRKGKSEPDPTGITVVDIDFDNNWYAVYVRKMHLNAPQLIDQIFWLWQTFKPIKIGVEKVAFENQVKPYLTIRSNETGIYPVVEELKHGGRNKEDRIRGALMGRLANNKIWFLEDATDDTDALRDQLYDFPVAKEDDISDALAYVDQIGFRPFSGGSKEGNVPTSLEQEMAQYRKEALGNVGRKGFLHDTL